MIDGLLYLDSDVMTESVSKIRPTTALACSLSSWSNLIRLLVKFLSNGLIRTYRRKVQINEKLILED